MVRQALKYFVVKTDIWPMSWVYRSCYAIALKAIVHLLKKQPDIVAIYLTSGMVTNKCIAGLSDFDLIIMIKGCKEEKQRVRKCCSRISRLIPFLGEDEQGIYNMEDIKNCNAQADYHFKYKLFIECKNRRKLLWGTDVLGDLKTLDVAEHNECIIGQSAFIWSMITNNFLVKDGNTGTLTKNYSCYKLTADACRGYILARNGQIIFDRKEALAHAQLLLDSRHEAHMATALELEAGKFSRYVANLVENSYDFCMDIIQNTVEHIPAIPESNENQEAFDRKYYDFASIDFILSDVIKIAVDSFVHLVEREYNQYISSVMVSPPDLLHLREENIGIFIVPKKHIPLNVMKELIATLKLSQPCLQRLYLYVLTNEVAFCMNGVEPGCLNSVLFPLRMMSPTLLYLSTPFSTRYGKPLNYHVHKKIIADYFGYDCRKLIGRGPVIVRQVISDQNILNVSNKDFHLFFWQAIRLKLIETCIDANKIFIPLSSSQVCQRCQHVEGFNLSWLEEFHDQYRKDLNGVISDSERYFPQALKFLKELYVSKTDSVNV